MKRLFLAVALSGFLMGGAERLHKTQVPRPSFT